MATTVWGLEKNKYPSNTGKAWKDDEVLQLLRSIRNKKSIDEIAEEHQRTTGGIRSRLYILAVDYYFNDEKTIEQIIKITGLDEKTILEQIKKKETAEKFKEIREEIKSQKSAISESTKESSLLNDVHATLRIILAKLESIESDVEQLKKNGSQISVTDEEDLLLFTSGTPVQSNDCLF